MFKQVLVIVLLYVLGVSAALSNNVPSLDKLETLFTSKSERSLLEGMKKTGKYRQKSAAKINPAQSKTTKVKVNGLVKRENGQPVIWVNSNNTLKPEMISDSISIKSRNIGADNKIPVVVNNKKYLIKPGQEWQESNNTISDSYQIK